MSQLEMLERQSEAQKTDSSLFSNKNFEKYFPLVVGPMAK